MSDNQKNNKIEYNELKKKKTVYRDLLPCLNSPIRFGYIHSKAWKFLNRSAEIYQRNDPCGMPDPDFNIEKELTTVHDSIWSQSGMVVAGFAYAPTANREFPTIENPLT